jgi:hypothetical protein
MAKRSFCVGINDYPYDGSDLNGCVNDARAWATLLREHFDFAASDVKLITDAQATKTAVKAGLKDLLAKSKSGDVLVFTNSSHGTYVVEEGGDEPGYDEAMCPYDVGDEVLRDDELRELFSDLPKGVHLSVISDSCFSGTVTRAALRDNIPGLRTPDDRRVRFLSPALRGGKVLANPWKARTRLSGCTDREYSYDALIGGVYHGAMTYFALEAIRSANYHLTYAQLHARLSDLIEAGGYPQHPQLEGSGAHKRRQIFT